MKFENIDDLLVPIGLTVFAVYAAHAIVQCNASDNEARTKQMTECVKSGRNYQFNRCSYSQKDDVDE